ncbi:MAG TPA: hypothetical protein VGJ51_19245, partial [Candidatus Angelobacter sp.]
ISLFVAVLWVLLLWKALPPFSMKASINWEYLGVIAVSFAACVLFVTWGKTELEQTNQEPRRLIARKRKSGIDPRT